MSSSLDKLVSNLPSKALMYTNEVFRGEQFNLMKRKGVCPYDYMDSFQWLNDKQLPFERTDEHVTDEDYNHALTITDTVNLNTTGEYHELYLMSDILLLADVFENFRKTCFNITNLTLATTSPGLSWDTMLKMTDIELELMTDIKRFNLSRRIYKEVYST